MSEEAHLQARHYRRGTILGLTLAELLMLLLFLFLLIMAFVINEREERIRKLDEERLVWRTEVPAVTGIPIPAPPSTVLSRPELDRPIEDLRAIRDERDDLRRIIEEVSSPEDLADLVETYEQLNEIAEEFGEESPSDLLDTVVSLFQRARSVRPGQRPDFTLEEGLEELGSGLEACIWMPFEPGADTKRVAYSYIVTLVPEGVRVSEGNPEAFSESWTGDLPRIPPGTVMSVSRFNQLTRRFYEVGEMGAPIEGTNARRPCRFYIRLQRSRRIADVDVYENLVQRVQQNFFRSYQIEIVD